MNTDATYRRITPNQLSFLLSLRIERGLEDRFSPEQAELLSVEAASRWISKALTLPKVAAAQVGSVANLIQTVPEGRYAIDWPNAEGVTTLQFFHVDKPTEGRWAGFTFVKRRVSDETYPVKGHQKALIIAAIAAAPPQQAAIRFGQEIGVCGVCGKTLTNEISRAYGIGPVCRERTGW